MRILLASVLLAPLLQLSSATAVHTHTFGNPIDAISIGIETDDINLEISALQNGEWTAWQALEIEKEFDPLLQESNLVLFPEETSAIRLRGTTQEYTLHPIRISNDPIHYEVAATRAVGTPKILSRAQWGADDSFLYTGSSVSRSDEPTAQEITAGESSQRVQDCEEAQEKYPDEFAVTKTITRDSSGQTYRWPQRYSNEIKKLVVHHTALRVRGDERSAVERVRALYEYHANNRGWGDIGYHYLIDENGQIYEGRAGGKYVVGGHVYCGNVETIGVVLMGNFEEEKPTQEQMKALQWLLDDLSKEYDLDLRRNTTFHGVSLPPVVGHGTLIATACPGYYIRETLDQVRRNVIAGNLDAAITFPLLAEKYQNNTAARKAARTSSTTQVPKQITGVSAIGATTLESRPGGEVVMQVLYRSGDAPVSRRTRIAPVSRSNQRIGIWQELDGQEIRVRDNLLLPQPLSSASSLPLRLRIQLPRTEGDYSITIGDITYSIGTSGRRTRTATSASTRQSYRPEADATPVTTVQSTSSTSSRVIRTNSVQDTSIRIRLGYQGTSATITTSSRPMMNGTLLPSNTINLVQEEGNCTALQNGKELATGIIKIDAQDGIQTIASWTQAANRFRGSLECRVVDGELVLINELPLEDYIAGLAEEPDTEPYQKQRAFAIAARSYAAFYADPANRKFPGKPYDGDDSPARFQKYGGVLFEEKNPMWVEAAKSTEGQVLKKNNQVVKAAYFSSNDGRTRSPEEIGWKNFPFADVFASKPDPWCTGMPLNGHGVGMSGCGAKGQANEGKSAEEILQYYYAGATVDSL